VGGAISSPETRPSSKAAIPTARQKKGGGRAGRGNYGDGYSERQTEAMKKDKGLEKEKHQTDRRKETFVAGEGGEAETQERKRAIEAGRGAPTSIPLGECQKRVTALVGKVQR